MAITRYAVRSGVRFAFRPVVNPDQVPSQTVLPFEISATNLAHTPLVGVAALIVKVHPPAVVVFENFVANVTCYLF